MAFVVRRTQMYPIRFDNVIFVVDEGNKKIDELLLGAMRAANKEHMRSLSLLIPRLDAKQKDVDGQFEAICIAVARACETYAKEEPNTRLFALTLSVGEDDALLGRALSCIRR